jgi:hypothetical protein
MVPTASRFATTKSSAPLIRVSSNAARETGGELGGEGGGEDSGNDGILV